MTTRKRKLPEVKPAPKATGFFSLAARAAIAIVSRHPGMIIGTLGVLVAFSFVSANAIWYQPGLHPSPLLRTRDPHNFTQLLGLVQTATLKPAPEDVTTFLIQRQENSQPDASAIEAAHRSQNGALTSAQGQAVQGQAVQGQAVQGQAGQGQNSQGQNSQSQALHTHAPPAVVQAVQRELTRLKLYDGPIDGLVTPKTLAAIKAYQAHLGMPANGEANGDLLTTISLDKNGPNAALNAGHSASDDDAVALPALVTPKARPSPERTSETADLDPVAAAIRNAEKSAGNVHGTRPVPTNIVATNIAAKPVHADTAHATLVPPAAIAPKREANASLANARVTPGMIMDIQRGLTNIAYASISIDGVVGEATKSAILSFQRHYRMAETGEPSAEVLAKLKSIGAL